MKVLLILLAIRIIIRIMEGITASKRTKNEIETNKDVYHPAEFELREGFHRIEQWV